MVKVGNAIAHGRPFVLPGEAVKSAGPSVSEGSLVMPADSRHLTYN